MVRSSDLNLNNFYWICNQRKHLLEFKNINNMSLLELFIDKMHLQGENNNIIQFEFLNMLIRLN